MKTINFSRTKLIFSILSILGVSAFFAFAPESFHGPVTASTLGIGLVSYIALQMKKG